MSEALSIIFVIFLILLGLYGVVRIGIWADERKCTRIGKLIELETRYDHLSGCFIRHEGKWRPMEGFRTVD